jgi:hypothetical protein
MQPRDTKGNKLRELEGDYWMSTSSTILDSTARMVIHGLEKFTWLGWCESWSTLGGQLASPLAYPKISFLSRCERQFVKDDSNV